jgi:prepilin-type N-terminal cleavage/methylation domain-containing protein
VTQELPVHDRRGSALRRALARAFKGFTLVDMMMAVAVMGVLALIALPALRPDEPLKLISAGNTLASDIEFAQSATLAVPSDPTILVVDPQGKGYWLALASDAATPILRPYSNKPYEVRFGDGDLAFLGSVTIAFPGDADGHVTFNALGRLDTPANARLVLSNASGSLAVHVASSTGSVSVGGQ